MTNPSTDFIPFARPSIGTDEEAAVLRVLRSGWLTTATEAAELEREFAAAAGAAHAVAVNSATAGLHLALEALGIGPGDRVAMSPYTFTATAEVVRYLGGEPLFVDIDPETLNISPTALRSTLQRASASGSRVRAVIAVHIAGLRCNMRAVTSAAQEYGAAVVEDSAHCVPRSYSGTHPRPGTDGAEVAPAHSETAGADRGCVSVFSFYATKPVTSGEGGMVVTDRTDLARRMRVMRLHGIDRDVWNRYRAEGATWEYDVVAPGYKYNLADLQAAIARVQLHKAERMRRRRAEIAQTYRTAFAALPGLLLPAAGEPTEEPAGENGCSDHGHHLYIIRLREGALKISRDEFIDRLTEFGIGTSVHYRPLHLMSYYRDRYGLQPDDFPVSWQAYQGAVSLPIYDAMTSAQTERVTEAVTTLYHRHAAAGQD